MEVSSIFWDANVLIDFVDSRSFELEEIQKLYELAQTGVLRLYISESTITNCLYISRLINTNAVLLEISRVAKVLPCNDNVLRTALASSFTDKEDAILYELAAFHRMDAFITRNKKHFTKHTRASTPAMTPKEFLRSMK